jgi:UDP-glucose 4-epimerase
MKAFVTGGAGFIGSHLVDRLMADGAKVTVFDNLSSGKKEFIAPHLKSAGFRFVKGELLNLAEVKKGIKGHDIVFHLAANPEVRMGLEDTSLDLKQETIVSYNVLEAMRLASVRKIVFSSSSTIYGEAPLTPIAENYGPVLPISLYGAAKLACEGLVSAFSHIFGMQSWIYRFANIVGSRVTHGVIFDFITKLKLNPGELEILGDGKQSKPYLHVSDCVDGMLFSFRRASERVNVYNLGCDSETGVSDIARMLVAEMGLKDVKFRYTGGERGWPGDVARVRFNVDKMKKLGWQAKFSSDEAVRQAIKDILGDGECRR